MQKTVTALADYGDMPADRESLLLGKFAKVFTHLSTQVVMNIWEKEYFSARRVTRSASRQSPPLTPTSVLALPIPP